MKKIKHCSFTLVELLAAMFVFSILLTLSMQLFSGARQMWFRSEKNTNAATDARLVSELITHYLMTVSYTDGSPFSLTKSKVYFASAIPQKQRTAVDSPLRFYSFQCDANGNLLMGIFSDSHSSIGNDRQKYSFLFPPFDSTNTYQNAVKKMKSALKPSGEIADSDSDWKVLLSNTVLTFRTDTGITTDITTPPAFMEIILKIFDTKELCSQYIATEKQADKDKFENDHADAIQIFRKTVTLTDYQVE